MQRLDPDTNLPRGYMLLQHMYGCQATRRLPFPLRHEKHGKQL
jgi:hypothetical protein